MNATRLTYDVLRLSGHLRYRPFALHLTVLSRFAHQKSIKKPQLKVVKEVTRKPINKDIKLEIVHVANEGKLGPPEPLSGVLARVDLKKFYVELAVPDKAIVKIYDKQEERAKAKARRKAMIESKRANEQKEIQLSWGVQKGDLEHKLGKARKELEKQYRIDLVFAAKSKQPVPPPAERDEKVTEVLELLKDVGVEWQPRTFRRSLLTIHLRGIGQ